MVIVDKIPQATMMRKKVLRTLEHHIADEQQTGAETVGRIAETKVGLELDLRNADVDPVEIIKDVAEHQQGQDTQRDLAIDRPLERVSRRACVESCGGRIDTQRHAVTPVGGLPV
jgi:hypothetical protein